MIVRPKGLFTAVGVQGVLAIAVGLTTREWVLVACGVGVLGMTAYYWRGLR